MFGAGRNIIQCTSNTATFDRLAPLVCSSALDDEQYSQCLNRFSATYFENRNRVPANLQVIFDNTVDLGTVLIFTLSNKRILKKFEEYFRQEGSCLAVTENMADCVPPPAITDALAQSMFQANNGGHIDLFDEEGVTAQGEYRFHLWGGYNTYPAFMAALADDLIDAAESESPCIINFFISPDEEPYPQCVDRYTTACNENRESVPTNFLTVFDNIMDMGADLIYRSCEMEVVRKSMTYYREDDICRPLTENTMDCAPPQDADASIATCVAQANGGEHIELFDEEGTTAPGSTRFDIWGGMYTKPDFVAEVARVIEETRASETTNYFINMGTVPQEPTPPPEGSGEEGGSDVDRGPSEPDSPDGPPRGGEGSGGEVDRSPSGGDPGPM